MAEVGMNKKKKIGLIALFLLILLSLSTYFTVQWVNAKTIEDKLELGQKYYADGNYEEAIIAYEEVLDIEPKHVEARIGLAKSYAAIENVEKAAKVLVEGIKILPKEPSFYLELAEIHLGQNNILEAIKALDDGLSKTKDKKVQELHTETASRLELVVDKTILQVGQSSNMKVIYHSKQVESEEAAESSKESSETTDSDSESENNESDEESTATDESSNTEDESEEAEQDEAPATVEAQTVSVNATWEMENGDVGSLNNEEGDTNVFTSEKSGTETVTAKVGSVALRTELEIKDHVLTSIEVSASQELPKVGETIELTAIGKDADGKEMEINPEWSINEGSGSLETANGTKNTLSIAEAGTTEILVSQEDVSTSVEITVEENEYTLYKIALGNGTISSNPPGDRFKDGQAVTLTAVPSSGWEFDHWEGSVSGNNNSVSITMNADHTAKAVFKEIPHYTIFSSVQGEGVIQTSPARESYERGSFVTVKAVPATGWKFDHWEGDATGKNPEVRVTMDNSKTVRAVFVKMNYSLHVEVVGQGTVAKTPNQNSYVNGTTVSLKATPAEGWKFDHWEGDATGSNPEVSVTVNKAKSVKAVFTKIPANYPLTVEIEGEGTVTKTPDQSSYREGSTVTLKAVPAEGWAFIRWEGDVTGSQEQISVSMDKAKQAKAIFAQVGHVTGVIKNSRTGEVVKDVQVKLYRSECGQCGGVVAQTVTSEEGTYTLNNVQPGPYRIELSATGYNTKNVSVEITANETTTKNETIMPVDDEITEFSVVLTWGGTPSDLDSHLTGPIENSTERFHIYYGNSTYSENGVVYAELDTDETSGYGPETITTFKEVDGVYRYYVYNFSNSPSISASGAVVELFKEGQVVQTFRVPENQDGLYWHVFEIDHGRIVPLNRLANEPLQ